MTGERELTTSARPRRAAETGRERPPARRRKARTRRRAKRARSGRRAKVPGGADRRAAADSVRWVRADRCKIDQPAAAAAAAAAAARKAPRREGDDVEESSRRVLADRRSNELAADQKLASPKAVVAVVRSASAAAAGPTFAFVDLVAADPPCRTAAAPLWPRSPPSACCASCPEFASAVALIVGCQSASRAGSRSSGASSSGRIPNPRRSRPLRECARPKRPRRTRG